MALPMDSNVITIDNLDSKLSRADPSASPLHAVIDMGSNGIRFSISDLSESKSRLLPCIYRERAGISLYDALHESTPGSRPFCFSQQTIVDVARTLARFRLICDEYGVPKQQISVFATEAMRTAHNRDEMLEAIQRASGLNVEILSPAIESLFGAMGARSSFDSVDGLFLDLGGGSVQMTYMNSSDASSYGVAAASAARSMPFGAAKLSDVMSSSSNAASTVDELMTSMKKTFDNLRAQFPRLDRQASSQEGVTVYLCGGGFRGYGSALMNSHKVQPYPIPDMGGFTVTGSEFCQTKSLLQANDAGGKIFGISKRRRKQFPSIVLVVEALIHAVPKICTVTFCAGGNREGILLLKQPPGTRETNPFRLYPGVDNSKAMTCFGDLAQVAAEFYPGGIPADIFPAELLRYLICVGWLGQGEPDDTNSAKWLQAPITGAIAGLPGMTHRTRAIVALTMASRWGCDVAPAHKAVWKSLRQLVGDDVSWGCDYLGRVLRLLALLSPGANVGRLSGSVRFEASVTAANEKKSRQPGIHLNIPRGMITAFGVGEADVEGIFKGVGKGLDLDKRVEIVFL